MGLRVLPQSGRSSSRIVTPLPLPPPLLLLSSDMNSAEQTVTWLITLGVLESPKKSISDPECFLQTSLQDGAVLCRLLERLRPGTVDKVSAFDGCERMIYIFLN